MFILLILSIIFSVYYFKLAKRERELRKELSDSIELLQSQLVNSRIENKELMIQIKKELKDIKIKYNIQ